MAPRDSPRGIGLALTALIENRDKLRNARLAGDELMVRACAFWIADCAARVVLFLHHRYIITTRWFFRQAFDCPELPPRFQEEVELLLGVRAAAPEELAATAERLVDNLIVMARRARDLRRIGRAPGLSQLSEAIGV